LLQGKALKIFAHFLLFFLKDRILPVFSIQFVGREWGRGQFFALIHANPPVLPRSS